MPEEVPGEDVAMVSPKVVAAEQVVVVADRNSTRSVLMQQQSLPLDNNKPKKKKKKKFRPLLQKLRAGCSKLVRSAPFDVYGGEGRAKPAATQGAAAVPEPPKNEAGSAPVEFKGIMNELRRSSDVVRAILWNLSFRDANSSSNVSDVDSSTDMDVDMLFDRHEQRRYADYELENDGCLPGLDSLPSIRSLSSTASGSSVASEPLATDCPWARLVAVPDAASNIQREQPELRQSSPPKLSSPTAYSPSTPPFLPPTAFMDTMSSPNGVEDNNNDDDDNDTGDDEENDIDNEDNDLLTIIPKLIIKIRSSLSLDQMNEMAEKYTHQYLMTLPPLFLAVVRKNPTIIYLLLKYGGCPNAQVSHFDLYRFIRYLYCFVFEFYDLRRKRERERENQLLCDTMNLVNINFFDCLISHLLIYFIKLSVD